MAEERKKFKKRVIFKIIQIILILALNITVSVIFIGKIKKENEDVAIKKLTINSINATYQTKIQLKQEYELVKPYLDKVKNFLFKEDDIPKIISSLENLAQETTGNQSGIKTKSITSYPFGGGEAQKIDYIVTLTGNQKTFLEYCKKFEELPYFLKMDYINISGLTGLDKTSQMVCGVSFFIEKPQIKK